jgi:membrane-bound lytic murein transglycosylase B
MSITLNNSKHLKAKTLSTLALCLLTASAIAAPAKKAVRKAAPAAVATAAAATAVAYAGRGDAMQLAEEIAVRRDLPVDWVRAQLSEAQPARGHTPDDAGRQDLCEELDGVPQPLYRPRAHTRRRAVLAGQPPGARACRAAVRRARRDHRRHHRRGNHLRPQHGQLSRDGCSGHAGTGLSAIPPRAQARTDYFRGELEQVLVTASRTGSDPFALRGSYAGAMGLGQFMPTSWDKYAVDFDGDGRIDLFNSATDAIGSVANYFVGHGWKPGLPTAFTVDMRAQGENLATLLAPDINPTFTAAQMAEREVRVLGADNYERPLALIELKNGSSGPTEYIAGTENFYAITRYNWSAFYALSVIELGREVHEAYLASQTASATRN